MNYEGEYIVSAKACSYPLRFGNTVKPLIDGIPAYRRICQAVEQAKHSVWVTVAFLDMDLQMPDNRGSFFDVLDKAQKRGIDVRVIFWRNKLLVNREGFGHFYGTEKDREFLRRLGMRFLARWDNLEKTYCHHQKSWVIDAGKETEVAFVGGINLGIDSMVNPSHNDGETRSTHDVYSEIRGPSVTDVHHNFVQRWNEASDQNLPDGSWPENIVIPDMPFPQSVSPVAGNIPAQVARTVRKGNYTDTTTTPGGDPFQIENGEYSCLEHYTNAINAARETIYIEDQAIGAPAIVEKLKNALKRGVQVIYIVPGKASGLMVTAQTDPQSAPFFELLKSLGQFPGYTLAALASQNNKTRNYLDIFVHSKVMIVDGVWGTIGSCNVANRSYYSDTELNVSFWDRKTAEEMRNELFAEHLGMDVSDLDEKAAFEKFRKVAQENTMKRTRNEKLQGLAFQLDPAHYPAETPWLPNAEE